MSGKNRKATKNRLRHEQLKLIAGVGGFVLVFAIGWGILSSLTASASPTIVDPAEPGSKISSSAPPPAAPTVAPVLITAAKTIDPKAVPSKTEPTETQAFNGSVQLAMATADDKSAEQETSKASNESNSTESNAAPTDSDPKGDFRVIDRPEGVPAGVTVRYRAVWSDTELTEQDGKTPQPRTLKFEMEYVDGIAAKVVGYGHLMVSKLAADPAQHLKLINRAGATVEENPYKGFVDVQHREYSTDHPEKGVRITLDMDRPAVLPKKLTALEGQVTLRIAEETKEIIVPELFDRQGKPVDNKDLKAAGFVVLSKTQDKDTSWNFTFAKGSQVADLKLVTAQGEPLTEGPSMFRFDSSGIPNFNCSTQADTKLAGIAAKITLHTKLKDQKLPFRFTNVSVPAPPDPKIASVIPWTLSSAKAKQTDGLAIDGHLRWDAGGGFGDTPAVPELLLDIDVSGPRVALPVASGFQKLTKATTDKSAQLKLKPPMGFSIGGNNPNQYVRLENMGLTQNQSPDGTRITLSFGPQASPSKTLTTVSGSFKLLVAKEQKIVTFEKVASRIGKSLPNADLRTAGLELKLAQEQTGLAFTLAKGNAFSIAGARLLRETPEQFGDSFNYDPTTKTGSFFVGDNPLKPNDGLEVTYYTGISEIEIPFFFEKLQVPKVPAKAN